MNSNTPTTKKRIPEHVIQQVRELDISDALAPYLDITKNGSGLKAICPFHNDTTPSLSISPSKGIYKCFPCGAYGTDAISVVMKVKSVEFLEAVRIIAADHKIEIQEEELSEGQEEAYKKREAIFNVNKWAASWYSIQLKEKANAKALEYVKSRWNDESVESFCIGYAPGGEHTFITAAKESGYQEALLLEAGLITESKNDGKENTYYTFRNRIMFPVHNKNGNVCAFSARVAPGNKDKAKYINTRDTEFYHKSKILYGLHIGKPSIKKQNNVYLVEGNCDVVKLRQIGVCNCVALSGTSLTIQQIEELKKITECCTLIPDMDPAGEASAIRSAKLIIKHGLFCKIIPLPAGDIKQDPDSFFTDKVQFDKYVNGNDEEKGHKKDYIFYLAETEKDNCKEPDQKARLIADITSMVLSLPEATHDDYFTELGGIITPKTLWKRKNLKAAIATHKQKTKKEAKVIDAARAEKNEPEYKTGLAKEAKKYIRVRTDFYKRSFTLTAKKEKAAALFYWKKGTITEDYGRDIIKYIAKYDSFVNIPDNSQEYKAEYLLDGNNYFNLFEQSKYIPSIGKVSVTLDFLKHIFQDKFDVALDYMKILYENPVQKLPVICLVSKVQETGKSTFLRWVCNIFDGNGIILGNEDFAGKFNSHFAGKLVIGIDESFIDRNLIKEKIKRLVTDEFINLEAKGRDVIKVDFIGKFILLSNKESNFIQMEDEDNRFFVCKVPQIKTKDPDLDKKLTAEIPAFLHYLKAHELVYEQKSRLWFDSKVYETDALRKIVMTTRSKVEKEMIQWFESIFDTSENYTEIEIIPRKLADYIGKNLKSINALPIEIERILKEEWNLIPDKNQKFYHPYIKEHHDPSEDMVVSTIGFERHTGKPYKISRSFIDSKIQI